MPYLANSVIAADSQPVGGWQPSIQSAWTKMSLRVGSAPSAARFSASVFVPCPVSQASGSASPSESTSAGGPPDSVSETCSAYVLDSPDCIEASHCSATPLSTLSSQRHESSKVSSVLIRSHMR